MNILFKNYIELELRNLVCVSCVIEINLSIFSTSDKHIPLHNKPLSETKSNRYTSREQKVNSCWVSALVERCC